MKGEKRNLIIAAMFLSFLFLFSPGRAQGTECSYYNSPKLNINNEYTAIVGNVFYEELNISNGQNSSLKFQWIPIKSNMKNLYIDSSKRAMNFTPKSSEEGNNKILIVVSNEEGCFDSKITFINIYGVPKISKFSPINTKINLVELSTITFGVTLQKNNLSNIDFDNYSYNWYIDDDLISHQEKFVYTPGYEDQGNKTIKLVVFNAADQNTTILWEIEVKNKNREPVFKNEIPDKLMYPKQKLDSINLDNYFQDLDKDELEYSFTITSEIGDGQITTDSNYYAVSINENYLEIESLTYIVRDEYIKIFAKDSEGAFVSSNSFLLRLVTLEEYNLINRKENEDCVPELKCNDWGPCLPQGIRQRECIDLIRCSEDYQITETETCSYIPNCEDGIKNQDETSIDCGGICGPCPTCKDYIKNERETDIDCGGPNCDKCSSGKKCKIPTDCLSFICTEGICQEPSCFDNKRNQDEENIDCGGICGPCPTCFDEIKNQNETSTDCGGPCLPCPTCDDGEKNQDEEYPDCGGSCTKCSIWTIIRYNIISAILISGIFVTIFYFVSNFVGSFLKRKKGGMMHIILHLLNKINIVKKTYNKSSIEKVNSVISKLRDLRNDIAEPSKTDTGLASAFNGIISEFFNSLLEVYGSDTGEIKNSMSKKYKNPFLKMVLIRFYNQNQNIKAGSSLFRAELINKITENIDILNDIKNYL